MTPLTSLILKAFAISHATTEERVLLDKGDAQWSIKLGVYIYVSYTLINALITICTVMMMFGTFDASLYWSAVIAFWVVIVGVNIWISGIYANNTDLIWKCGNEIREDPNRGPGWARRRSRVFLFANAAYAAVMILIALKKV